MNFTTDTISCWKS